MKTPKQTLDELRAEIQKGIDDLEAGRFRDGDEVMAEIRERLLGLSKIGSFEEER